MQKQFTIKYYRFYYHKIWVVLAIVISGCCYYAFAEEMDALVVGVSDGDTITALYETREMKVRLHGIDCPEKGQAFGKRAREFTSREVYGKSIGLDLRGWDRYGRIIAVVYYDNGKCLNTELLREGLAWHYKKYSSDQEYARLEEEARQEKRGVWADNNARAPWEYRRKSK